MSHASQVVPLCCFARTPSFTQARSSPYVCFTKNHWNQTICLSQSFAGFFTWSSGRPFISVYKHKGSCLIKVAAHIIGARVALFSSIIGIRRFPWLVTLLSPLSPVTLFSSGAFFESGCYSATAVLLARSDRYASLMSCYHHAMFGYFLFAFLTWYLPLSSSFTS